MTAAQLIHSLPKDPDLAVGEIDGALRYGEWSDEDRARIETARKSADKRRRGK